MNTIIYRIDNKDIIKYVSDNWLTFAQENKGGDKCHPDNVINSYIWDYIDDDETVNLYKMILKKARNEWKVIHIPFRCDSPDLRRLLELEISPLSEGMLQFRSLLIRAEQREHIELLENKSDRSDGLLSICSICKKVKVSGRKWLEIEDAIVSMKLFEHPRLPRLANGLCDECDDLFRSNIDKIQ